MAAYVDSTGATFDGVSSTRSLAHTLGGTATRVIGILWANGGSGFSATWDGVAMTLIGSKAESGFTVYVFQLANPTTGAKNLVFNWTGNISGCMIAAGYSGNDTSLGMTTFATNSAASAAALTTNLTAISGWTLYVVGVRVALPTIVADTGSTLRLVGGTNGDNMKVGLFDSNADVAGATSMAVTATAASIIAGLIVSLPRQNAATYTDNTVTTDGATGAVSSSMSDTSSSTDSVSTGFGNQQKSATSTWTPQTKS